MAKKFFKGEILELESKNAYEEVRTVLLNASPKERNAAMAQIKIIMMEMEQHYKNINAIMTGIAVATFIILGDIVYQTIMWMTEKKTDENIIAKIGVLILFVIIYIIINSKVKKMTNG
jgi:hypothetical protein